MKKLAILFLFSLATISCSSDDAEATPVTPAPVTDTNTMKIYNKTTGAEIKNGDVIVMTSNTSPNNKLAFYIKNITSSAMNVKSRLVSMTNTDGSGMSYCIGETCFAGVAAGTSYPGNSETLTVPANGTAGGDGFFKMENTATPDGAAGSLDYVFEFYQYNNDGEVGNKVKFTYRYTNN